MTDKYVGVPYAPGSDTSQAAAEAIKETAASLRARVLAWITARGALGATSDEIHVELGIGQNTVNPRVRELVLAGHLRDSGGRRPTRSGRTAAVWVATLPLEAAPPEKAYAQDEGGQLVFDPWDEVPA